MIEQALIFGCLPFKAFLRRLHSFELFTKAVRCRQPHISSKGPQVLLLTLRIRELVLDSLQPNGSGPLDTLTLLMNFGEKRLQSFCGQ